MCEENEKTADYKENKQLERRPGKRIREENKEAEDYKDCEDREGLKRSEGSLGIGGER